MTAVATAIIGSAVVGAAASAYASNKASKAQRDAADRASNTELAMYDQNREDMAPWREAGGSALSQLSMLLGIQPGATAGSAGNKPVDPVLANFDRAAYLRENPDVAAAGMDPWTHFVQYGNNEGRAFTATQAAMDANKATNTTATQDVTGNPEFGALNRRFTLADMQRDPGYDFRLSEGLKGINSSAAARGGALSGGALKALTEYGQGMASQEYGNAYNRYNADLDRRYNRLASLAGVGQTVTQNTAQMGQQVASNIAGNTIGAGNARASGYVGGANAIGGGLSDLASMYYMNRQRPTYPGGQSNYGTMTGNMNSDGMGWAVNGSLGD